MHPTVKKSLSGAVACAALGLGGAALADAASESSTSTTTTPSATTTTPQDRPGPGTPRRDEQALTGDTADKVKAAALAEVPGATVLRLETDSRDGGAYEAHLRKSDGTFVRVEIDKDFKVTAVRTDGPRGRGFGGRDGRHGPGGRGGDCPNPGSGSGSSATPGSYGPASYDNLT